MSLLKSLKGLYKGWDGKLTVKLMQWMHLWITRCSAAGHDNGCFGTMLAARPQQQRVNQRPFNASLYGAHREPLPTY